MKSLGGWSFSRFHGASTYWWIIESETLNGGFSCEVGVSVPLIQLLASCSTPKSAWYLPMVEGRNRVAAVSRQRPRLGPLLYLSSVQYFAAQVVVAELWHPPYSWSRNTISDLGNTVCGTFNAHRVCSPSHNLMNLSFVFLGTAMLIGSMLIRQANIAQRWTSFGFRCMEVAGVGVILVGLFPENSVSALHGLGAALTFVLGNIAVIVLGVTLRIPLMLRVLSVFLGVLALAALIAYASSHFLGMGEGGIERLVAFPQTVWLIGMGVYLLHSSRRQESPSSKSGSPIIE